MNKVAVIVLLSMALGFAPNESRAEIQDEVHRIIFEPEKKREKTEDAVKVQKTRRVLPHQPRGVVQRLLRKRAVEERILKVSESRQNVKRMQENTARIQRQLKEQRADAYKTWKETMVDRNKAYEIYREKVELGKQQVAERIGQYIERKKVQEERMRMIQDKIRSFFHRSNYLARDLKL